MNTKSQKLIFLYKNNKILILSIFSLLIPLIFFSVNDYEEYKAGIHSTKVMYSNFSNFFSNFNIKLGFGSTFPAGQGLFFYPTSFFSTNYKLFVLSTVILNSLIQYKYFRNLGKKILEIKDYKLLNIFTFFLIISLPNLSYNFFSDWISHYTSYTLLFPIIYYVLKYQKFNQSNSLVKLTLFTVLFVHNGHLAYSLQLLIIVFTLFISNKTNLILHKKKIIMLSTLFVGACFQKFYELFIIYKSYPFYSTEIGVTTSFDYFNYMRFIFLPLNYILRILDHAFKTNLSLENIVGVLTGKEINYGIQIILAIFSSFIFIIKNKSKQIFYLNYLLIFLLIIYVLNNHLRISNYLNLTVDSLNVISLFILIYYLFFLKTPIIRNTILCILLISNILLYVESFKHLKDKNLDKNLNKLYSQANISDNLIESILSSSQNSRGSEFSRIYLSEKVYKDINDKRNLYFKLNKIYSPQDFSDYGLNIFNVSTKNVKYVSLRESSLKMHNVLYPRNPEIQNDFLMSLFRIKFILIYETELKDLNNLNLKKINEFNTNKKNQLLLVENLNFNKHLILNNDNFNYNCDLNNKLDCLLKFKNNFIENKNISIKIFNNHEIEITNYNTTKVKILLPYLYNDIWKRKDTNQKIFNYFSVIELKPNEIFNLNFINLNYIMIKLVSILSIIYLIFITFRETNIKK